MKSGSQESTHVQKSIQKKSDRRVIGDHSGRPNLYDPVFRHHPRGQSHGACDQRNLWASRPGFNRRVVCPGHGISLTWPLYYWSGTVWNKLYRKKNCGFGGKISPQNPGGSGYLHEHQKSCGYHLLGRNCQFPKNGTYHLPPRAIKNAGDRML